MTKKELDFYDLLYKLNTQNKNTQKEKRGYKIVKIGDGKTIKLGNKILYCREELYDFLYSNKNSYVKNLELLKDCLFFSRTRQITGVDLRDVISYIEQDWGYFKLKIIKVDNIDKYIATKILSKQKIFQQISFPWFYAVGYSNGLCEILTEYNIEIVSENLNFLNTTLTHLYIDCLDIKNVKTLNCFLFNAYNLQYFVLKNFDASNVIEMKLGLRNVPYLQEINIEDWNLSLELLTYLYSLTDKQNINRNLVTKLELMKRK